MSTRERFEQHRIQFGRSMDRLHEALDENETPLIRDALIQRFEFTFEMAWLCLYDYLAMQGAQVPKQAFSVIPLAFQSQLITDAQIWDQMRTHRNSTSHTYDEAKAIVVAAFVRGPGVQALEALRAKLGTL